MEITSKPTTLDEVDRGCSRSNGEAPWTTRRIHVQGAAGAAAQPEGSAKQKAQRQWDEEKSVMTQIQSIKEEIDSVDIEIQQEERDYDLNRAAELKYGNLISLEKHLATTTSTALRSSSMATSFRSRSTWRLHWLRSRSTRNRCKAMLREEVRCPASLTKQLLTRRAPFQTLCAPNFSSVRAPFQPCARPIRT